MTSAYLPAAVVYVRLRDVIRIRNVSEIAPSAATQVIKPPQTKNSFSATNKEIHLVPLIPAWWLHGNVLSSLCLSLHCPHTRTHVHAHTIAQRPHKLCCGTAARVGPGFSWVVNHLL